MPPTTSRFSVPSLNVTKFLFTGLVCALYLLFLNAVVDFYKEQQHDPFTYLKLAKSLIAGEGYPTKHWMPGFPAMLALWTLLFGQNFILLKLCMVGLALVLAIGCYYYFRSIFCISEAGWLTLLVAVSPLIFAYSHKLMSEIPCVAFTMLALALTQRILSNANEMSKAQCTVYGIMIAFSGIAAVFMRGNALALVPALISVAFQTRTSNERYLRVNWPLLLGAISIVVAFGMWSIRNRSVQFSNIDNITYLEEIQAADIGALWDAGGFKPGVEKVTATQLIQRIVRDSKWFHVYNLPNCIFPGAISLRDVTTPVLGFPVGFAIAVLLCVPFALGIIPLFRLSVVSGTFLLFSLLLVLIYPTGGSARMLISSVPLLVCSGYLGIRKLLGIEMGKGWLIAAVCFGIVNCAVAGQMQHDHPYAFDEFGNFLRMISLVKDPDKGTSNTLVTNRPNVVEALTTSTIESVDSAIKKLRSGQIDDFMLIEFEDFQPIANLSKDLRTSLLDEQGSAKLWIVKLRDPPE